jgi:hypothetical protein
MRALYEYSPKLNKNFTAPTFKHAKQLYLVAKRCLTLTKMPKLRSKAIKRDFES